MSERTHARISLRTKIFVAPDAWVTFVESGRASRTDDPGIVHFAEDVVPIPAVERRKRDSIASNGLSRLA
jgi:hypothetical protein